MYFPNIKSELLFCVREPLTKEIIPIWIVIFRCKPCPEPFFQKKGEHKQNARVSVLMRTVDAYESRKENSHLKKMHSGKFHIPGRMSVAFIVFILGKYLAYITIQFLTGSE